MKGVASAMGEAVVLGVMAMLIAVPMVLTEFAVASSTTEPAWFVLNFWVTAAVNGCWSLLVVGYPWAAGVWIADSNGEPHQDGLDGTWRAYFVSWLLFIVALTVLSWQVARRRREAKGLVSVRQAPARVRCAAWMLWFAYLGVVAALLHALIR